MSTALTGYDSGRSALLHNRLGIDLGTITHPAAVLGALRVVVRPVHESTELVPFVHAPDLDAIAHAERHTFCQIEIVGNQQSLAIANIDDESLVAGTVVIVMQKAVDEASDFDPPPVITFRKTDAFSSRSAAPS